MSTLNTSGGSLDPLPVFSGGDSRPKKCPKVMGEVSGRWAGGELNSGSPPLPGSDLLRLMPPPLGSALSLEEVRARWVG
jgi:hypothetical protein